MSDDSQPHLIRSSLLQPMSVTQEPLSTRWVDLCDEAEVALEGIHAHEIERGGFPYPVITVRTSGGLYALHDECPHRRVLLSSEGYLEGEIIHCGFHHWGFSLETGEHTLPTQICVERFEIKVEAGRVWIAVSKSLQEARGSE